METIKQTKFKKGDLVKHKKLERKAILVSLQPWNVLAWSVRKENFVSGKFNVPSMWMEKNLELVQ